ncbi:MAG: 5-oxoprolinase/urea amidolyase family protein [Proteobacteria bacterium]|nr:5-oxoprolinase/urea amidolyase family protein [Pseudomonadota bacterium]
METLEILHGGTFTTIQDLGRKGYQRFGMPTAGAMDTTSLRMANRLVQNDEGQACLEITLIGLRLLVLRDIMIAITGGDLMPRVNGSPLPLWQTVSIPRDSEISFTGVRNGIRSYLAVAGGIQVPEIMGSKSTYIRGGIGGLEGKALTKGDRLRIGPQSLRLPLCKLKEELIPCYGREWKTRVIMGPQDDYFSKKGIETFISSEYTITPESDRMGYRLEGPVIEQQRGADIISDATCLGSIQVPGQGLPIILFADRQTTGGYPKIATAISVDIYDLGQAKPGDKIRFSPIGIAEAHTVRKDYERRMKECMEIIR